MRNVKIMKHKRILVVAGVIIFIVCILGGIYFFGQDIKKQGITKAEAAKVIVYAAVGANEAASYGGSKQAAGNYWYSNYVDYIKNNEFFDIDKPTKSFTLKDFIQFLKKMGVPENELTKLSKHKKHFTYKEFAEIFNQYLSYMPYGKDIHKINMAIAGTPATLNKAGEWEVYTTKGKYTFTGLVLNSYVDKSVEALCCGSEILMICDKLSDSAVYKNIWVKSSEAKKVYTNVYGADRDFYISGLSEPVAGVLADIEVQEGNIKAISVKTDTITGNVLSVTDTSVEVQGYGLVPLDEYFMIYDINNGFAVKKAKDIVVGYALQDFIVAEGKICGAVISKPLNAQNIRVIVKTNGFKSIFHDNIQLTADKDFTVHFGEELKRVAAGEVLTIDRANEWFKAGRITIIPDSGGQTKLLNVTRSQGNPVYEGNIELVAANEGIVVVNDIDIENYLKRVVPSEMPASYDIEALKVQAVCARSYAYKELSNGNYSQYGAHVDDSTMYQVYNNTVEYDSANQAIAQTKGRVLTYNNEVVQTYYYSTSCGVTTDVGIWGSQSEAYPYFKSVFVGKNQKNIDLTNEENFTAFITSKDENDYDSNRNLYRWELEASIGDISNNFNQKLYEKYLAAPQKILTKSEDGNFISQKITTVGEITSITINERAMGGAVKSLTVAGTKNTVRIDSESCIRGLFGMAETEMKTNTGTAKMASLPSTFCIFKPIYDGEKLSGYKIVGGGYGHGIGMSQNAADTMAKSGMDYKQILVFFYPGTQLK